MEHSHRGKEYEAVHNEAIALLRELSACPRSTTSSSSRAARRSQFAHGADELPPARQERRLHRHRRLGREGARRGEGDGGAPRRQGPRRRRHRHRGRQGEDRTCASRRRARSKLDPQAAYVHFTSNETIHGVEFAVAPGAAFPDAGSVPLVCDMSSDFVWRADRRLALRAHLRRRAEEHRAERRRRRPREEGPRRERPQGHPKILQYRTHAENNSLYNTPPTFAIYLVRNVLAWTKDAGRPRGRSRRGTARRPRSSTRAIDARPRLLPVPRREGEPLGDERRLPAPDRGARGEVRRRGEEAAHGRPQGAPLGRRHPRVALQRRDASSGPKRSSTS